MRDPFPTRVTDHASKALGADPTTSLRRSTRTSSRKRNATRPELAETRQPESWLAPSPWRFPQVGCPRQRAEGVSARVRATPLSLTRQAYEGIGDGRDSQTAPPAVIPANGSPASDSDRPGLWSDVAGLWVSACAGPRSEPAPRRRAASAADGGNARRPRPSPPTDRGAVFSTAQPLSVSGCSHLRERPRRRRLRPSSNETGPPTREAPAGRGGGRGSGAAGAPAVLTCLRLQARPRRTRGRTGGPRWTGRTWPTRSAGGSGA